MTTCCETGLTQTSVIVKAYLPIQSGAKVVWLLVLLVGCLMGSALVRALIMQACKNALVVPVMRLLIRERGNRSAYQSICVGHWQHARESVSILRSLCF